MNSLDPATAATASAGVANGLPASPAPLLLASYGIGNISALLCFAIEGDTFVWAVLLASVALLTFLLNVLAVMRGVSQLRSVREFPEPSVRRARARAFVILAALGFLGSAALVFLAWAVLMSPLSGP